ILIVINVRPAAIIPFVDCIHRFGGKIGAHFFIIQIWKELRELIAAMLSHVQLVHFGIPVESNHIPETRGIERAIVVSLTGLIRLKLPVACSGIDNSTLLNDERSYTTVNFLAGV